MLATRPRLHRRGDHLNSSLKHAVRMVWGSLLILALAVGFFSRWTGSSWKSAFAEQSKVVMSAEVVTPTNLFVQVAFRGWSVPYAKVILWDLDEERVYIQEELDNLGEFNLAFVLPRAADLPKRFELFAQYKGLESKRLIFEFSPSTYDPGSTINLVLPPLVDISQTEITTAQEVKLIAYTCVGCEVTWLLVAPDSSVQEEQVVADEYGYAEVLISKGLVEGAYQIKAMAQKDDFQSQPSTELTLTVRASGSAAGGGEGVYAYGPAGVTIEGLSSLFSSPWFRFGMLSALGVLLAWLLRSSLEVVEQVHRMWRWIGPALGHMAIRRALRSWWLKFFPFKRPPVERTLRVYAKGSRKPILVEKAQEKKEPFHLELPPGQYRLVWEEPDGLKEKTDLIVSGENADPAGAAQRVAIQSAPPSAQSQEEREKSTEMTEVPPEPASAEAAPGESSVTPNAEIILDHQVFS